ncbi:MAG: hypothetical protein IKE69_01420 [Thermoguttaceae bacterium]|nr:hypothetical protein [Thermoguttaceae bacterium]
MFLLPLRPDYTSLPLAPTTKGSISRESKVWNAAKKAAGTFFFGIFMKVLVETATRYAMSRIETL